MMLKHFITLCAVAATAILVQAKVVRDFTVVPAPGSNDPFTIHVDSIDFRSDLTRVYGHLYGRPNTSALIDNFFISPDASSIFPDEPIRESPATDIDGFEFTHRFQWEENGDLPIEIDFPAMRQLEGYFLRADIRTGSVGWKVIRAHGSKHKQRRKLRNGHR